MGPRTSNTDIIASLRKKKCMTSKERLEKPRGYSPLGPWESSRPLSGGFFGKRTCSSLRAIPCDPSSMHVLPFLFCLSIAFILSSCGFSHGGWRMRRHRPPSLPPESKPEIMATHCLRSPAWTAVLRHHARLAFPRGLLAPVHATAKLPFGLPSSSLWFPDRPQSFTIPCPTPRLPSATS